jgi:hypothetical protein
VVERHENITYELKTAVIVGNYRTGLAGTDLNRKWKNPDEGKSEHTCPSRTASRYVTTFDSAVCALTLAEMQIFTRRFTT